MANKICFFDDHYLELIRKKDWLNAGRHCIDMIKKNEPTPCSAGDVRGEDGRCHPLPFPGFKDCHDGEIASEETDRLCRNDGKLRTVCPELCATWTKAVPPPPPPDPSPEMIHGYECAKALADGDDCDSLSELGCRPQVLDALKSALVQKCAAKPIEQITNGVVNTALRDAVVRAGVPAMIEAVRKNASNAVTAAAVETHDLQGQMLPPTTGGSTAPTPAQVVPNPLCVAPIPPLMKTVRCGQMKALGCPNYDERCAAP